MPKSHTPKMNLIPLYKWEENHSWPNTKQLRYFMRKDECQFNAKCVKRVGSRILIDETAFFDWVEFVNRMNN